MRVEDIRKLRAANYHLFQGLEDILRNPFLQGRVVLPSPVDVDVEVSQLGVAELESVAFEKAVFGPFLRVSEADVNLADKSIHKGGEDLVLELVSPCSKVLFSTGFRQTRTMRKLCRRGLLHSLMYTIVCLSGERMWRGSSLNERGRPDLSRCSCVACSWSKSRNDAFRKQSSGKACLNRHSVIS